MNTVQSVNQEWGQITIPHEGHDFNFPYHIRTGEVYNFDPPNLIRFKCTLLTVVTPAISVARSVYWLAKAIFLTIIEAFRYVDGQEFSCQSIIEAASDSRRAITFGAYMTGYAMKGIVDPYNGRQQYGKLERELNKHFEGPHRNKFYLAFCFQRRCCYSNDEVQMEQVRNNLTQYVTKVLAIQKAIHNCAFHDLMTEYKAVGKSA